MRHAGPVGIAQQLIAHVQRGFKRRHPRKWLHGIWRQRTRDVIDRIEPLKALTRKIPTKNFRQLPRHEYASPQQISPGIAPTKFEKPGNVWTQSQFLSMHAAKSLAQSLPQ